MRTALKEGGVLQASPKRTRFPKAFSGFVLLAIFGSSRALAFPTLRDVTNSNDDGAGSLRVTIIQADLSNTGDTIIFDSGVTSPITLTSGVIEITHSLHISRPGAANLAISGGGASQVFKIDSGATVTISGLTIENGKILAWIRRRYRESRHAEPHRQHHIWRLLEHPRRWDL